MNRELKFRAWNGSEMVEVEILFLDIKYRPEIKIMQFTGLKDENGKEIYAEDKLKIQLPMGGFWGDVKKEETGIVKYIADIGGYVVKFDITKYGKNQSYVRLDCDIAFTAEIVGDIYSTPELLK